MASTVIESSARNFQKNPSFFLDYFSPSGMDNTYHKGSYLGRNPKKRISILIHAHRQTLLEPKTASERLKSFHYYTYIYNDSKLDLTERTKANCTY